MKSILVLICFISAIALSGFDTPATADLVGVWVRKSDHLRIKVQSQDEFKLTSFIIESGTEEFPCDVDALPIYKNIKPVGRNLWSCDFLIVTMGSCSTEYEGGMIRLTNDDEMEITCPGFEKKFYTKLKPRLESE